MSAVTNESTVIDGITYGTSEQRTAFDQPDYDELWGCG